MVRALAFIADPEHPAYVGELDLHGRARLVAQGIGARGPCVDYISRTLDHMHEVGVRDPHLERILHAALALRQNGGNDSASLACTPAPSAARQPAAERLARFYGELLGDRVAPLPDGSWLVAGRGRQLVVGKGDAASVPYFALQMQDAAHLEGYRKKLSASEGSPPRCSRKTPAP
jgi:hypothetical protein